MEYVCNECNYNTNIKGNYLRHMKSTTHFNRLNIYTNILHTDDGYMCKKCLHKYKNERHCFTHTKKCDVKRIVSANTSPNIPINRKLNDKRYLYYEYNMASKLDIGRNQLSNKLSYINKLIDRSKTIRTINHNSNNPNPKQCNSGAETSINIV